MILVNAYVIINHFAKKSLLSVQGFYC